MPNISNQDMRYREESSGEHLTKDGQPDHRYKENRSDNEHNSSHITKDGQPDHRYKENRSDSEHNNGRRSNEQHDDKDDSARLADIPTKADGTADMRYTESREAVASGLIQRDEVVEEAMNGDHHQQQQQQQGSHLKNDGTADKRYKENQNDEE